jgi:allophanate hydrolase
MVRAVYRRIRARDDDHVWIHLVSEADAIAAARRVARQCCRHRPRCLASRARSQHRRAGLPSTSAFPPSRRSPRPPAPPYSASSVRAPSLSARPHQLAIGLVGVRSPYGVARNAFEVAFVPRGSSAGSGVAVGAGLVSFALGNDAAGSGRVPAAFNNVVGIKPTPGLVSNTEVARNDFLVRTAWAVRRWR